MCQDLLAAPIHFNQAVQPGLGTLNSKGEKCRVKMNVRLISGGVSMCNLDLSPTTRGGLNGTGVGSERWKFRPHRTLLGVIPNQAHSPACELWDAGAQQTVFNLSKFHDIRLRARKGSNKDRPSWEVSQAVKQLSETRRAL